MADRTAPPSPEELPGQGPAGLLDPRRRLVSFTGRDQELDSLLAWCESDQPRGVRLVTGPGGVGKTRLSVELAARLGPAQWRCVRVGEGEASALATARRGWPGQVLLVVDYAETRLGLGELLRAVAADAGPVRVLLLARSAGEWRDRLAAGEPAVRELLADAGGDEPLTAAVSGELSNEELVRAAVPVFAQALGIGAPSPVLVAAEPEAMPVLDLHAAALVAVLRSPGPGRQVRVRVGNVLEELLGHEERFWQGTAERLGLLGSPAGMPAGVLRQIVAAGALLGAGSQEQALELLGRVPGAVVSVPVACWLRDLYPPDGRASAGNAVSADRAASAAAAGGTEWLGSLRPDRLAERLVVTQLNASAELAARCLTGLDERQALRAVTLLGHAAAEQRAAAVLLERLLPLLEQVVSGLPDDVELLTELSDAIPYPSAALAEADVAVTRRILQILPNDDPGLRGHWLSWLGTTLAQTGHWAEALFAEQDAVKLRREAAAAAPEKYRPDLARSLSNLGIRFCELGRPADALTAEQEAVEIRRELADASPGRHRPDLARSLANLGVLLSKLDRPAEALTAEQEAVQAYRELAATSPETFRPDLAGSLANLGATFLKLGRPADALPLAQEAADAYRELAAAYPDRYRTGLAWSLANLGATCSELGRPADALPLAQEAADAYQELAAAYPERHQPGLADSLSNLSMLLSELGRQTEALPPAEEAVQAYRELAAAYPDRYQPDLARSLSSLSILFADLGRRSDALPPARETVEIRRELATASPERYRPDLARSLSNLSLRFAELDRPAEALLPAREAVEIRRELATAAEVYRPDLAISLRVLALALDGVGRAEEAEDARCRADLDGHGSAQDQGEDAA